MNIFFLRGAHLSGSDELKSVMAFAAKTGKSPAFIGGIAKEQAKDGGLINEYKLGKIATTEFVEGMIKKLESPSLSQTDFIDCWNSMCVITAEKIAQLTKVAELQQQHGFEIHMVSGTNPLQYEFVKTQLALAVPNLSFDSTLSFEQGKLDRELVNCIPDKFRDFMYEYVSLLEEPDNCDLVARVKQEYPKPTSSLEAGFT